MGEKIKVLHIITRLIVGGADENTILTCEGLDKNRYEVTLACGRDHFPELLQRVEKKGVRTLVFPSLVRPLHPLCDLKALVAIYRHIRGERYHIVHTHSSKAGILGRVAARLAGVPVIIHTVHGFGFNDSQPFWLRALFVGLERWCARFTHRLITVSRLNIDKALQHRIGRREQYVTIYSGIDMKKFAGQVVDRDQKKRELGLEEYWPVVGMVARMARGKGHEYFLQAAVELSRRYPHACFLLVGDGEERERIRALAEELGLKEKVVFLGQRDDVPEVLRVMDVLVHPSLWEGLPRVVPEALAAGVPVVATPVDGVPEVIRDGENGLFVPPGDAAAIVEKVAFLLENPEHAMAMASRGRRFVLRNWDAGKMVQDIERVYQEFLEFLRK